MNYSWILLEKPQICLLTYPPYMNMCFIRKINFIEKKIFHSSTIFVPLCFIRNFKNAQFKRLYNLIAITLYGLKLIIFQNEVLYNFVHIYHFYTLFRHISISALDIFILGIMCFVIFIAAFVGNNYILSGFLKLFRSS